jgi:hypothetical protein
LKKEFDIHGEWLGFEIHPETPREGMLLTERFSAAGLDQMYDSLQQRGEALGIIVWEADDPVQFPLGHGSQ